jgi:hypothetical protein
MDAIDQMRGAWDGMRDSMASLLEHVAALEARNAELTVQAEAHATTIAFLRAHLAVGERTIADLRAAAALVPVPPPARAIRLPVVRHCTVCSQTDHNRATCPRVERKMTAYITA